MPIAPWQSSESKAIMATEMESTRRTIAGKCISPALAEGTADNKAAMKAQLQCSRIESKAMDGQTVPEQLTNALSRQAMEHEAKESETATRFY